MDELPHKLVSEAFMDGLIAPVGWLPVQCREKKGAEAVAPAPVEGPAQALLRHTRQADRPLAVEPLAAGPALLVRTFLRAMPDGWTLRADTVPDLAARTEAALP
ncbi:hypothetical protein ACFCXR_10995 [Streptomyces noursei]|uniref:hypothetical protein n=1 Tax=Streptomyces noursei TaxID=1971 RepID=UPI0035D94C81